MKSLATLITPTSTISSIFIGCIESVAYAHNGPALPKSIATQVRVI